MEFKLELKSLGRGSEEPEDVSDDPWASTPGPARKFNITQRWQLEDSFYEQMATHLELGISAEEIKLSCQERVSGFIKKHLNHDPVQASAWERIFVEYLAVIEDRRAPILADRLRRFRKYLGVQADMFTHSNRRHREEWTDGSGESNDPEFSKFIWEKVNNENMCDDCFCSGVCLVYEKIVNTVALEFRSKKIRKMNAIFLSLKALSKKTGAGEVISTEDREAWARWRRVSAAMAEPARNIG